MAERYLFSFPDGRTFDTDGTKSDDDVREAYPQARITHQAELDEQGGFVAWRPYTGKQPKVATAPADATTTTTPTKAPARPAGKKAD